VAALHGFRKRSFDVNDGELPPIFNRKMKILVELQRLRSGFARLFDQRRLRRLPKQGQFDQCRTHGMGPSAGDADACTPAQTFFVDA
jgi:hypothetical protein